MEYVDIGIYKITNKINGKCYVGQSCQIHKRWQSHIIASNNKNDKAYNYPLYKDFREYGVNNFEFEIIEEIYPYDLEKMLKRESYWINKLNAEYNQTIGENNNIAYSKLTEDQSNKIKEILLNDSNREVSHKDLAIRFGVHTDTIRDINVGRTWYNENLSYPLHYSKYDGRQKYISNRKVNHCIICGCEISKKAKYCLECYNKIREKNNKIVKNSNPTNNNKIIRPSKEELDELIHKYPFTKIGEMFGVPDNSIRKWCKKYELPYKYRDLHPQEETNKEKRISYDDFIVEMSNEQLFVKFENINNAVDYLINNGYTKENASRKGIRDHIAEAFKNNKTYLKFNWNLIKCDQII